MGISNDDIERIRATVRLSDVVQPHTPLRRVGARWQGRCPFHAEKSPSFSVNDELGFYKCFGCGVSGDVITFVREIEHLDFVGAVESLANKAGLSITYTNVGESKDRQRSKRLKEAMAAAVAWYHERLLTGADAGHARGYLRSRGIDGLTARGFSLGWAPEGWDELARGLKLSDDVLRDTGLGFLNQRGRQTDALRGRIIFPIFDERGDAVAMGGRIMPGVEGPKYKNSPETPIYSKSRTLYGLNWAKDEAVRLDQIVVCEGYTDVIGFHASGVKRAVATCGTALTEDHVRLLRKFAQRIVLAFDADAAGQNAADRFYAWEKTYDVSVSVVGLPPGVDPGDLARTDPTALVAAVDGARPYLAFRLDRLLASMPVTTPEQRARAAEAGLAVINEHPNAIVRRQYAGEIAVRCGLPAEDLVRLADRGTRNPTVKVEAARPKLNDGPETTVLRLLVHQWVATAPRVVAAMFHDPEHRRAVDELARNDGDVRQAIDTADPAVVELLTRLAVEQADHDPEIECENLLRAAVERELRRDRVRSPADAHLMVSSRVRTWVHQLDDPQSGALSELLGWLDGRDAELTDCE